MISNRVYKLGFLFFINCGLFYLIIQWLQRHVRFHALIQNAHYLSVSSVLITLFLGILLLLVYAYRLSCLLQLNFYSSFGIVCLGHGGNSLLPFRLGEVFKIFLAKKIYRISLIKLCMASFIEKFLDLFSVLLIAVLFCLGKLATSQQKFILFMFISMIIFFIALTILNTSYGRKKINTIFQSVEKKTLREALIFIKQLLSENKINKIMISTVVIWFVTFLMFYSYYKLNLFFISFHAADALLLVFFTTLLLGLPSAPAGLGLFETAIVYYLMHTFGIAANEAVFLSLFFHFLVSFPQILLMALTLILKRNF